MLKPPDGHREKTANGILIAEVVSMKTQQSAGYLCLNNQPTGEVVENAEEKFGIGIE